MNVLRESNINVISFLGGFQRRSENIKYRWNNKIISVDYGDDKLMYNGITGATIFLYSFEYDNILTEYPCDYRDFLYENYFLVREDFDEI